MFALKKDYHNLERHVLVEITGYRHAIEAYQFSRFDTVNISQGEKKFNGILLQFAYRLGGGQKNRHLKKCLNHTNQKQTFIIGYCSVNFICSKQTKDYLDKTLTDKEGLIFMEPSKIVLIEKNLIGYRQKVMDDFYRELKNNNIVGG